MVVQFDPVIFSIGPLAVRWYGLMYVVGFIISGFLLKVLSKTIVKPGLIRTNVRIVSGSIFLLFFLFFLLSFLFPKIFFRM